MSEEEDDGCNDCNDGATPFHPLPDGSGTESEDEEPKEEIEVEAALQEDDADEEGSTDSKGEGEGEDEVQDEEDFTDRNVRLDYIIGDGGREKQWYDGIVLKKLSSGKYLVRTHDDGEEEEIEREIVLNGINAYKAHYILSSPDPVEVGTGVHFGLEQRIQEFRKGCAANYRGLPGGPMHPPNQAGASLLSLLEDCNAPQCVYPSIRKWLKDNYGQVIPTRPNLMTKLAERYGTACLKPRETTLLLPNAGTKVVVATYCFESILCSLLTDPELIKDPNYCFPDPNDPFSPPPVCTDANWNDQDDQNWMRQIVGDISTSRWYSRTYYIKCKVRGRDVLCPLLIFMDKTHTDCKGRLTQEIGHVTSHLRGLAKKLVEEPVRF